MCLVRGGSANVITAIGWLPVLIFRHPRIDDGTAGVIGGLRATENVSADGDEQELPASRRASGDDMRSDGERVEIADGSRLCWPRRLTGPTAPVVGCCAANLETVSGGRGQPSAEDADG
ncbi:MAG: hypothetical protein DI537_43435 [Stutzerimonas stutzeri]|nr:MAG: hypothetical protein DI537_43435 [Stutzerimonas stutzeri]